MWQILNALKVMHSAGYIHRDVKPANILVKNKSSLTLDNLVLIDFGFARNMTLTADRYTYSSNMVTHWYRSPLLSRFCSSEETRAYDHHVDLWSVGCIFAEMFLHEPLFQQKLVGESTLDFARQLALTHLFWQKMDWFMSLPVIFPPRIHPIPALKLISEFQLSDMKYCILSAPSSESDSKTLYATLNSEMTARCAKLKSAMSADALALLGMLLQYPSQLLKVPVCIAPTAESLLLSASFFSPQKKKS